MDASPAWANDCVEAFLATEAVPWRYLEVVLDAAGGIYAARVENPDASRATWRLTPQEPPEGLIAEARGEGEPRARARWSARLAIPWDAVGVGPRAGVALRGNFFRIARGRATRHLALSPTRRADPPEFHVPTRFTRLVLL